MPTAAELESIDRSLENYRTQLAALSHALGALRIVSDQIIAALDKDRAALATHLASPAIDEVKATTVPAEVSAPAEHMQADATAAEPTTVQVALVEGVTSAEETTATTSIEVMPAVVAVEPIPTGIANDAAPVSSTDARSEGGQITSISVASKTVECSEAPVGGHETAQPAANRVVSLKERLARYQPGKPEARRAMAVVASLIVMTGATLGMHELLQTDIGQRLLELGTCDGDMVTANRDCSLLSWLLI